MNYDPNYYTQASSSQRLARSELAALAEELNLPDAERRRLSPMFTHAGQTARMLAMYQIYEQIVDKPGIVLDFGTWRGQTAIACEHFRSIMEPFNTTRKILAFDTFEGYRGFDGDDAGSETVQEGTYSTGLAYAEQLQALLDAQFRASAVAPFSGIHHVVPGDVRETLKPTLSDSHEIVALAWFDMNAFSPTLDALRTLIPHLASGAVLAFWQFNRSDLPGERRAFAELRSELPQHELFISRYYPTLAWCRLNSY